MSKSEATSKGYCRTQSSSTRKVCPARQAHTIKVQILCSFFCNMNVLLRWIFQSHCLLLIWDLLLGRWVMEEIKGMLCATWKSHNSQRCPWFYLYFSTFLLISIDLIPSMTTGLSGFTAALLIDSDCLTYVINNLHTVCQCVKMYHPHVSLHAMSGKLLKNINSTLGLVISNQGDRWCLLYKKSSTVLHVMHLYAEVFPL